MFSSTENIRDNLKFIFLWNRSLDVWDGGCSEYHPVVYIKNWYFIAKNGTILIKYKYKEWILLVFFLIVLWKTADPRVNFEKRFDHYEIYALSFIPPSRIQSLNEMALCIWRNLLQLYFILQRRFSHQFYNERKRCKSTSEEKRT